MLRAIIVDDEMLAIKRLIRLLGEIGNVEIAGTFNYAEEALEFIKIHKIDVIFLDIEMPLTNGIELSEEIINLNIDIDIVFVTAYNQYAIEAFELNALDYLLKPVSVERLRKTLSRIDMKKVNEHEEIPFDFYVKCFGEFDIEFNNGKAIKWRTNKAKELMAYLIFNKGKATNKEKIMIDLWPDFDAEKASANLYTTVYYLRKMFRDFISQEIITSTNGMFEIKREFYRCDYYEFEGFFENYTSLDSKKINDEDINNFCSLLNLYKGEFFDYGDYNWAIQKRLELENKFIKMSMMACDYYISKKEFEAAAMLLKNILQLVPLSEETHIKLLELYVDSNNKEAYDKHCDFAEKLFQQELGVSINLSSIPFTKLLD